MTYCWPIPQAWPQAVLSLSIDPVQEVMQCFPFCSEVQRCHSNRLLSSRSLRKPCVWLARRFHMGMPIPCVTHSAPSSPTRILRRSFRPMAPLAPAVAARVGTLIQFRESPADGQAAEAVWARIDWKYLRGLELTDPGVDFSMLSEFRDRLLAGNAEERSLDTLLERCRALGLHTGCGRRS